MSFTLYDQDGFLTIDREGIEWCDAEVHYLVTHDGRTVFARAYDEGRALLSLEGSILTADRGPLAGRIDPVVPGAIFGHELTLLEIDGFYHVIARYQDREAAWREPQVGDVIAGAGERYYLFFDTLGEPFASAEAAWDYVHRSLTEAHANPASQKPGG